MLVDGEQSVFVENLLCITLNISHVRMTNATKSLGSVVLLHLLFPIGCIHLIKSDSKGIIYIVTNIYISNKYYSSKNVGKKMQHNFFFNTMIIIRNDF